jgi:two-component system phosphate regulon response regulator PhoB
MKAISPGLTMAKEKILVVEDDKHISKLVSYSLKNEGFESVVCESGEKALEALDAGSFDLIVLDLMLPEMDGLEVCQKVRQDEELSHLPIVMLTAKGEEVDRVVGFELGADDYVVKPFSPRELVLRIKAILKRKSTTKKSESVLSAGDLYVDIPRHKVTINEREISLTPMEFNLLVMLMQRRGRVLSRDVLLDNVWGFIVDVTTRTVDTHVKRLRQKLGKMGKWIETVRGVGYRFREED